MEKPRVYLIYLFCLSLSTHIGKSLLCARSRCDSRRGLMCCGPCLAHVTKEPSLRHFTAYGENSLYGCVLLGSGTAVQF